MTTPITNARRVDLIRRASESIAIRHRAYAAAVTRRDAGIVAAAAAGVSQADIARAAGVSPARVGQIIADADTATD